MKLADYAPKFIRGDGDQGVDYLQFRCPCSEACRASIVISFTPNLNGKEVTAEAKPWQRVAGSTFDDLTLTPSILLHPGSTLPIRGSDEWGTCPGWHGFLTNGELRTC